VKIEIKMDKELSSTLSLNDMSNRNNIPDKKCHSFGDKSDEDYAKADSFKSESLSSPSPRNKGIKEESKMPVVTADNINKPIKF
jgi:hypothetical protein